ncbi:75k gamma secalin [Venturia nashicola]|nr:75k gamma secalin [Venturia nashicola]
MNHNNQNYHYANYQSPNGVPSGLPNPGSGSPVYGNGSGNGNGNGNGYSNRHQNYNRVPPQPALNYGQVQYSPSPAYNNVYRPPPSPSPQHQQHQQQHVYSHPVVLIPQQQQQQQPRMPHPTASPNYNIIQNHNYQPRQHHQQQPQWQNYQQQAPRPVQFQAPPQYPSHSAATATQRSVKTHAMVEIPVQRMPQQHVPKIPQKPQSRPSSNHQQRSPSIPQPRPQPQQRTQSTPKPAKSAELPPDYHQLLLALADEYICAAHGMASKVAFYKREEEVDEYHRLIATGLGCMESALINFRLLPRDEALLTLQYANLLFNETENYDLAEEKLSKAIALCGRNKLLDLKYSMHHLLARVLFKTKPRAALKSLDSLIPNVELYEQTQWVYAFRFLRSTLSIELASHHDTAAAIDNLHKANDLAESRGDCAILVVSHTLEAMIHLRSLTSDNVEQAQRAVAAARTHQLQSSVKGLTQVWALLDCIDLACSLLEYQHDQQSHKVEVMQKLMDDAISSEAWRMDDNFDPSSLATPLITPQSQSLAAAEQRIEWWRNIDWNINLFLTFLHCSRGDWKTSQVYLNATVQASTKLQPEVLDSQRRWTTFLAGVVQQGLGNSEAALKYFQDPSLALPAVTPNRVHEAKTDLSILAAFNALLIIRDPSHPKFSTASLTVAALLPLTQGHPNRSVVAAMHLIKSVVAPSGILIDRKKSVQDALNNGRSAHNSQIVAVTMSVMSSMFFKDIMGDQAQKSVQAAQHLAQRANSDLWRAVAFGAMDTMATKQAKYQDAQQAREYLQTSVAKLPEKVREALVVQQ